MQNNEIFRKVALDRLASPEQLDVMVRVIPANGWFALAALGLLTGFALVWGWFGSIPTTVTSEAIIINRGGLVSVESNAEGRVEEMLISVGQNVAAGDPVAKIDQPELRIELSNAEGELAEFRAEKAAIEALIERSDALMVTALVGKREALESERKAALENAAATKRLVDAQSGLLRKKLITQSIYLGTVREFTESRLRAESVSSEIKQLDIDLIESQRRDRAEVVDLDGKINKTRRTIESLKDQIARNTVITSPYTGRVVELSLERGALVGVGDPMVTLEERTPLSERLEVKIYPTTADGKKIRPGMDARIMPSTVKREESGYMLGRVSFVSDYSASRESMLKTLQSESLVEQFISEAPRMEVRADLLTLQDGSAFRWSSTSSAPPLITSGTLAEVDIVVTRQRPLTLVVPILKKFFGLD